MDKREEKIEQLTSYFENRDDIVMAFLFGSQAKGCARSISDSKSIEVSLRYIHFNIQCDAAK